MFKKVSDKIDEFDIADKIREFNVSEETERFDDDKNFINNKSQRSPKFVIRGKKVVFGFLILCLVGFAVAGVFYFKDEKVV